MAEFTRDSINQLIDSKFTSFNQEHELLTPEDKILLACSGNIDSVFALHYLKSKNYNLSVAVVDHLTREGESTKDAEFVKELAEKLGLPYFLKTIDVKSMIKNSGNFQETARNERYSFFNNLLETKGFTKLITAHHGDDNIETMLMNLGRASGLKGMRGILPINGKLIRPFLCLRKRDITSYVHSHEIAFRKDTSNEESTYKRNYFRNEVIPEIEKRQSDWVDQALKSMAYLGKWEKEIEELGSKMILKNGALLSIPISELHKTSTPRLYLHQIISSYGFNMTQVKEMWESEQVGKQWISPEYILYRERETFDFFKRSVLNEQKTYSIGDEIPRIGLMTLEKIYEKNKLIVPKDIIAKDLVVRYKKDGDFIQTKQGKKKLKKLFTDEKWSNFRKKTSFVVAKENEVYWLEGY